MSLLMFGLMLVGFYVVFQMMWGVAAFLSSTNGIPQFYDTVPVRHFGIVVKTTTKGTPVRVIHNIPDRKLVKEDGYPLGKFVPLSDPRPDLQRLGPIERLLGIRFIGIPWFRRLYVMTDAEWNRVEMTNEEGKKAFVYVKKPIYYFSQTNLYGFPLPNLALGSSTGEQKERTDVTIFTQEQADIEDPYLAIILTKWMPGTQNRLTESVRSTLGHMSEDDLIGEAEAGRIVQKMEARTEQIVKEFGVRLSKHAYVDYEIAGSDDQKKKMEESRTQLTVDTRLALGTEKKERAELAGMEKRIELIDGLIKKLIDERKMSPEQAERIARSMLDNQGIEKTTLKALFKGAAGGANVNINAE